MFIGLQCKFFCWPPPHWTRCWAKNINSLRKLKEKGEGGIKGKGEGGIKEKSGKRE